MKLLILFPLILFLFCSNAASQTGISQKDSLLVFAQIKKADEYFDRQQYDTALLLSRQAADFAKTKKMNREQGWSLVKVVEVLLERRQLAEAEKYVLEINGISNQVSDTLLAGVSIMQRGQIKMYSDQPDQAILLLDKSIRAGLGQSKNEYLALAFNDLGYAWGLKGEYERQADFIHKSLGIYEDLGNDAGMGMTLGNLSTVYNELGQKEKAIEYAKRSLKYREKAGDINRLSITCCNLSQYYIGINMEEAAKYQELCIKYARQTGEEGRIIHAYITSSLVANARKNNKEAFDYEMKVIDLLEKSKSNPRMLARRYIAAAFYTDILKYDSSTTLDYYARSLRLSQELGDKSNLRDLYLYLSEYNRKNKNFSEAYINYKKHIAYRDSLLSTEKEERIAELEKQYETSKKDNEIDRLQKEQKIKQLEIEKQKAIIAGNTAIALQKQNEIDLLSKSKELQDVKIKQQEEELVKKELIATAQEQQMELAKKEQLLQERKIKNQRTLRNLLLAGLGLLLLLGYTYFNRYQLKKKLEQQNSLLAMRNTISQDLHDDIGASLSNINILNELARRNMMEPEKSAGYLSKASEDIQRISESLSDIVWNINPRNDDLQNLFIRMKRYAADMLDGKNITGRFEFPADETGVQLSMTQRRDLYLIFKEAVNNLAKYSGAKTAFIQLQAEKRKVTLCVEDDGSGFDTKLIKTGNGLYNMEQRARASGASLSIVSAPGKGTAVKLEIELA